MLLATALIRSWIIYYSLSVRWRTSLDYRPPVVIVLARRPVLGVWFFVQWTERDNDDDEGGMSAGWRGKEEERKKVQTHNGYTSKVGEEIEQKKTLNGMEPLLQCVKDKESFRLRCCIKPWV